MLPSVAPPSDATVRGSINFRRRRAQTAGVNYTDAPMRIAVSARPRRPLHGRYDPLGAPPITGARTTRALLAATCSRPPSFKDNLTRIYTDFGTSFLPPHFPFGHAPASTASDGTQARGEIDSTMNWRIGGVPLEATPPLA